MATGATRAPAALISPIEGNPTASRERRRPSKGLKIGDRISSPSPGPAAARTLLANPGGTGLPVLVTVTIGTDTYALPAGSGTPFSGNYNDLINKPTLFSGAYGDLSGLPTLFSGDYDDLSNKPAIPTIPDPSTVGYVLTATGTAADAWDWAAPAGGGGTTVVANPSPAVETRQFLDQLTVGTETLNVRNSKIQYIDDADVGGTGDAHLAAYGVRLQRPFGRPDILVPGEARQHRRGDGQRGRHREHGDPKAAA